MVPEPYNSREIKEYVIKIRRHFHQNPELSFKEFKTAEKIEEELKSFGLKPDRVAETGVIADIDGREADATVALRADIDALPVSEENKFEFVSKNKGIMHACGHDSHAAMLLAVAKIFAENRNFKGRIRVIFQPGEELPPGGAVRLIKEKVLDGVDCIIGQHVWAGFPSGSIGIYDTKPMMSGGDAFKIIIEGKGGHGARPHQAIDPIVIGAQIITAAQTIVSRKIDPLKPAVLTFGIFNSGTKENIIPGEAVLEGTIRAFEQETLDKIKRELENIISGNCASAGAKYKFEYRVCYPPLINDKKIVKVLEDTAISLFGKSKVVYPEPLTSGEDFSRYLEKVPGAFYLLGVGEGTPQHSPTHKVDEDALVNGIALMYESALVLLKRPGYANH